MELFVYVQRDRDTASIPIAVDERTDGEYIVSGPVWTYATVSLLMELLDECKYYDQAVSTLKQFFVTSTFNHYCYCD
jgi:hypothetical protein